MTHATCRPVNELDTVIEVIAANAQRDKSTIDPSTELGSLGMASLDVLQVVFDLESRLGIAVPDGIVENLASKTITDLAVMVGALKDGTWKPAP